MTPKTQSNWLMIAGLALIAAMIVSSILMAPDRRNGAEKVSDAISALPQGTETLDVTNDKVEPYLRAAEASIASKDLKEAGVQLGLLTDAVVSVDSRVSMPSDKARDNIALARNFIAGRNYAGASYALKHADEALDEMQRSDDYKAHQTKIVAMRQDVRALQASITKNDPSMIEKADKKLDQWWDEMKSWSNKTMSK